MVFSSAVFLFLFFPFFFTAYFSVTNKYKNLVALIGSLIFYFWGAPTFILVLLLSCWVDFYLIRFIIASKKKHLVWLSVLLNIGVLAYFKYGNFFIDNLITLGFNIPASNIVLPIGISFFTFQKLSYTIDTTRYGYKPLTNFSNYLLYIILFPQLIAGPIIRFQDIKDQLIHRTIDIDKVLQGVRRLVIGLSKKLLIADQLGYWVDLYLKDISQLNTSLDSWVVLLMYAFQLFFDFSGYTDMAIGIGKMLGFNFPENFNKPYLSKSITEFWQRWHITLSTWMRDYLYIPLGGNRLSVSRTYLNLLVVFFLSGLWHGASWNFVIWGLFHGFFLILERVFFKKLLNRMGLLSIPVTFFITLLGWSIFRIENLEMMWSFQKLLFSKSLFSLSIDISSFGLFLLILSILLTILEGVNLKRLLPSPTAPVGFMLIHGSTFLLLLLCIATVFDNSYSPFIYFRF